MNIDIPLRALALFSGLALLPAFANAAETGKYWLSGGGGAIFNKAADFDSLTLAGGKLQGGIILSKKHFLALELGSWSGEDSKESSNGEFTIVSMLDPEGHACCTPEQIAAMELTDGTHYTYSRNVKWQTLTLSYEYEFFNLPPKGISLRAGPTLGLALTKNEIKEHLMGVEMGHHHTVYQNVSSESDLAFTFGLNLALTVYFTDNWFFDTNYRASLLTSHTAGKNQASDRAFKTGSNTNHHIAVSIGVSF